MSREEEQEIKNGAELIDITVILNDYCRVLRRVWKRIILIVLVCTLLMGLYKNYTYKPSYTASATYTINIRDINSGGALSNRSFFDNTAAEQMAKTFPYILTSGVLQRKVAKDLELAYVPGTIKAEVVPNTNFLVLSVTDENAKRANETLQAVVENYPSVSEAIVGKTRMEKLDETGVPSVPDNPKNLKLGLLKGALIGLFLGLLWAALLMLRHKTIRRGEDCPRRLNKRCFGVVPYIHSKKRSRETKQQLNLYSKTIDPKFAESFRMIRNKVEHSADHREIKTILITSALAGEGKSTVAVNLALSLVQEGKKVALLDCDLRHPSDSAILNLRDNVGLAEYLSGEVELPNCVIEGKKIFGREEPFLFIPGGDPVEDASILLENKELGKLISDLEEEYDYVIIDSAPVSLLTDAGILAQYVQGAVFVVRKDFAKADHILDGMEYLRDSNVSILGCVLNGEA